MSENIPEEMAGIEGEMYKPVFSNLNSRFGKSYNAAVLTWIMLYVENDIL